jgi:phage terminase large subunit GpA-like protein
MLFNTANNPGNQIFLMPSQDMAKSFSETRFQPIIDSSPEVAKHKPSDRHKYKMLEMHFATGTVNFIGGSSAANLAGRSAGFLFMDEIDKLQAKLKDEADPISLLRERAKWFPNRKVFLTSTPTVDDGHVWKAFLEGSQEYYYWPCPHCDHKFTPKWHEHVKFPNKYGRFDDGGAEGDEEISFSKRGDMSYIECPECEGKIVNKHKRQMLAEGEWVAHNEDAPTEKRSFHFNEIMSPITPLPKLVLKFLEAQDKAKKGDLGELQNFVNSSLSEPWRYEPANTLKDSDIENLVDIDRPRFEVPAQAHGLIAGVDTQDNGFYFVIRAFGAHNSSWLVHEGFVTDLHALEQVLFNSQYDNYSVGMVLIDSQGHRTDEIHQWCRRHINRAIPAVGRDSASMSQDFNYSQVDRGKNGQKVIGGLQRVLWNTVSIKDQLFYKMRVEENLPGAWRLHKDVNRFYKKNLRSEYKNEKGMYEKRASYENHFLDCEAMAYLGAVITGIQNLRPPERGHVERRDLTQQTREDNYKW